MRTLRQMPGRSSSSSRWQRWHSQSYAGAGSRSRTDSSMRSGSSSSLRSPRSSSSSVWDHRIRPAPGGGDGGLHRGTFRTNRHQPETSAFGSEPDHHRRPILSQSGTFQPNVPDLMRSALRAEPDVSETCLVGRVWHTKQTLLPPDERVMAIQIHRKARSGDCVWT